MYGRPSQDEDAPEQQLTEMVRRGKGDKTAYIVSKQSNGLDFRQPAYALPPNNSPRTSYSAISYPALSSNKSRKHANAYFEIDGSWSKGQGYTQAKYNSTSEIAIRSLNTIDGGIGSRRRTITREGTTDSIMLKRAQKQLQRKNSNTSIRTIKSITSSIWAPKPTLISLPTEILNNILSYLDQKDLHSTLLVSTALVEAAANKLYHHPLFATTYRYAQFAYTVSHSKHYADRVRILDVSNFTRVPQFEREPEAGWREWKFRNHDMYRANSKLVVPPKKPSARKRVTKRSHPQPNPFLEAWALSRDIPLGALCHALKACQFLQKVDISRVQLAEDFEIVDKDYPPSTWTGSIYVSDVPKSWTWKSEGLKPIYNIYIIDQLVRLQHLETVVANNSIFLSTLMIQELVDLGGERLKYVDFKDSGLEREKPWAIRGTREEVKRVIREMERKGPISPVSRHRTI